MNHAVFDIISGDLQVANEPNNHWTTIAVEFGCHGEKGERYETEKVICQSTGQSRKKLPTILDTGFGELWDDVLDTED